MAGSDKKPPAPPKGPKDGRERKESTLVLERTKKPRRFKCVMHNDDYTPMEFVVHILENIFHRSKAEATRVMLTVHSDGAGIAGVYSREVAETKAANAVKAARSDGYPLLVTTEPE